MIGKVPPNALDFEKLVIGTCLIDHKGLDETFKIFSNNSEVFYDPRNKVIYSVIASMKLRNMPVDMMTVIMELKKLKTLESAGGDGYVIELTLGISSSAHIEYHCRIVWEKYIKRKVIEAGNLMINKAFDDSEDVFEVLDFTSKETTKIHHYLSGQKPVKSFADVHKEFVEFVKSKTIDGVPMPFSKLQEENQGWQGSDMIVIAARPAMGKTALALAFGKHGAIKGSPVHFFSLEMANIQLHKRIVSNELEIDSNRIRKKRMTEQDLEKVFDCRELKSIPFYYDDDLYKWEEIKARARYVFKEKGTKLIIIDYLQLITTQAKMSTYDRVTFVSREIKLLAKELNIPVIVLSQLSRDVEKRTEKKPQLSDLRESGAIEQDADVIMFPYRPEYYGIETWNEEEESETSTKDKALLISAKNRHCGESELVIGWNPQYQRFYDLKEQEFHYEQPKIPTATPSEAFGKLPF
ncbi:replicative DNA helicase [Elizabethkingia meningoseptica]|uniref:replicative DNA helicase n=1 Tax=Elizabethkingia meningoseptica TaxID=238 RepID=UPI00136632E0|nr:replicative DNA helicase [Elizabethkingia meningoseptica]MVW93679.1 replicative DNA helicase [Elizabethkingia meningoseptica]